MKKLLCVLIACFALPVLATDWYSLGANRWIDNDSVKHENGHVTYLIKTTLKTASIERLEQTLNKKIGYQIISENISCKDKTNAIEGVSLYDEQGNLLLTSKKSPQQITFTPIVPGTIMDIESKVLCN